MSENNKLLYQIIGSVVEKHITEMIMYLHAQTLKSAVLCTVIKAFCLSLLHALVHDCGHNMEA